MHLARVTVSVDARVPTGQTNAYVVGETDSLLVDPPAAHDDLDVAIDLVDIGHIAVTHTHPDHVGGVAHYAEETGATVWVRRGRESQFEAMTGISPDRTFAEGTALETGDGSITVLDVPGHASDHVAFVVDDVVGPDAVHPSSATICGDLAMREGSVVVGAPEGDMRGYLTALRRLRARDPDVLYPGHGPVIREPTETIDRLISHRLDRERRVLDAVRNGARSPDEVVEAAYEKDLTGFRDLARATVVAHIEKLAVEGRVAWNPSDESVRLP